MPLCAIADGNRDLFRCIWDITNCETCFQSLKKSAKSEKWDRRALLRLAGRPHLGLHGPGAITARLAAVTTTAIAATEASTGGRHDTSKF